ncbi:MAG: hypothetical protein K2Q21_12050 [Chitinophagaceae bacterium]|nr:hypothetical protein [Chitinophagaceae bacterium]
MKQLTARSSFFRIADHHKQIGTTHFGLYMALLESWNEQDCHTPFLISRSKLMSMSRIQSTSTYHIGIKDLRECGAIDYQPSYHLRRGTAVSFKVE